MERGIISVKTNCTTPDQNNEQHEANELLQETKPMLVASQAREMEKTWTMLSPFQKEEALLRVICEPSVLQAIEALVGTKMVVSRVKQVSERKKGESPL